MFWIYFAIIMAPLLQLSSSKIPKTCFAERVRFRRFVANRLVDGFSHEEQTHRATRFFAFNPTRTAAAEIIRLEKPSLA